MPFRNFKTVQGTVRNFKTGKREKRTRNIPVDSRDEMGQPSNFVGGFGWNLYYDNDPVPYEWFNLREIFPIQNRHDIQISTLPLANDRPRSFEIIKEPYGDMVRLYVGGMGADSENLAKVLGVDSEPIYTTEPYWVQNVRSRELYDLGYPGNAIVFDVERSSSFDFSPYDGQINIINELIKACSEIEDAGVWIQIVYSNSFDWTRYCKMSSHILEKILGKISDTKKKENFLTKLSNISFMSSRIREMDVKGLSLVNTVGPKILSSYISRINSSPVILSIRGLVLDKSNYTINSISSLFSNVKFYNDSLIVHRYDNIKQFLKWMVTRNISGIYGLASLVDNCNMWYNTTWGRSQSNPYGRDYVPFICLTSHELNNFVNIPTDLTKVRYHKEHDYSHYS